MIENTVTFNEYNLGKWRALQAKYNELEALIKGTLPENKTTEHATKCLEESFMWAEKSLAEAQTYIDQGTDKSNGLGGKND